MFLDRAVRTTSHPSVATVCALLVLLLATGTVFGLEDGDEIQVGKYKLSYLEK